MRKILAKTLGPGDVFRAAFDDGKTWPATVRAIKKVRGKLRVNVEYGGGGDGTQVLAPGEKVPLVHRAGEPGPARRTRAQYLAEVKRRLAAFEPRLVEALRTRLKRPPPRGATRLDFEIHWSDLGRIPISGYFMGAADDQLGYFKVSRGGLFRWKELAPYHEDGVETEAAHEPLLLKTFLRAWKKAGGTRYPLAGVLQHHDATSGIDLRTLKKKRRRTA